MEAEQGRMCQGSAELKLGVRSFFLWWSNPERFPAEGILSSALSSPGLGAQAGLGGAASPF